LSPERERFLQRAAAESIDRQREIEASDREHFDEFLDWYFAQNGGRSGAFQGYTSSR
jgi:hypothetical protein